jgi:hypothetical protein
VEGSKQLLRKRGHLKVLPAQAALNAMEKQALRFHNNNNNNNLGN